MNRETPNKSTNKRNIQPLSEKSLSSINQVSRIASQYNSLSQKSKQYPLYKASSTSKLPSHSYDKSNNSRSTTPTSKNSRYHTPTAKRAISPYSRSTVDDTRSQGAGSVKNLVHLFSTMSTSSSAKHSVSNLKSPTNPSSTNKPKPLSIKENNEIAKKFRQSAQAKMAAQLEAENEKLKKTRDHSPFRPLRNTLQDDVSRLRSRTSSKNSSIQNTRSNSALRSTVSTIRDKSTGRSTGGEEESKTIRPNYLSQKAQSLSDLHTKEKSSPRGQSIAIVDKASKAAEKVVTKKSSLSTRPSENNVNTMLEKVGHRFISNTIFRPAFNTNLTTSLSLYICRCNERMIIMKEILKSPNYYKQQPRN
jgi:hypothetical protein